MPLEEWGSRPENERGYCLQAMRRRRRRVALAVVVSAVLVATASSCTQSKAAGVRDAIRAAGFGDSVTSRSDARMDRFGEQVCTQLEPNLVPSDPADPPRWIHYYAPGILQAFRDAYCQ